MRRLLRVCEKALGAKKARGARAEVKALPGPTPGLPEAVHAPCQSRFSGVEGATRNVWRRLFPTPARPRESRG
jgi:hypothetical protein